MDVAGSAVGIASLGITVCQGLRSYIDSWKDYGPDVSYTRDLIADLQGTLVLLEESLKAGGLDAKRAARVISCLQSCKDGLANLGAKLYELQKYRKPEGLRQRACAELQKAAYPFRKDTLDKLRGNVADVRERLKLALQVLQLSVQHSDRWRRIVDWLSAPDPWTNHRSARERHEPHTGDWLLQSPPYLDWKAGKTRHLWICGKAGCGKTVLSSTIIEDIKQLCDTDENLARFGLGAFYFTFSDKQKQSYEDLLRSLVEQLAWKQDGYSRLQQAFDNPSRGRLGKDELENILDLSFQAYDRVFITLDALDESTEENDIRQKMLEQLEKLVQNASNVKLLATSREALDIHESMGMLEAQRIDVADSKVDKDIRKYLVSELSKDRRLSRLSDKTTSLILDTLSARADGMFRWAYCQIQELKKLKSTKPKYIEDVLRTLPKTLDETYDRILCAIDERYRPEALTLLRWITYSTTPLTLRQLAEAAIIDPSDEGIVDVDNRGDIEDSVDILSGLILVYGQDLSSSHVSRCSDDGHTGSFTCRFNSKSRVRLAHFSVKEYLDSERILDGTAKDFHLDAADEHRFLAQSCLTYLMHYSNDITKLSTEEDQRSYPLLHYSANTWYYHSSLQSDSDLDREFRMLTTTDFTREWLFFRDRYEHSAYESSSNDIKPGLPIYYASYVGLRKVVEELLARGPDINTQGGYHGSALQVASHEGYKDIVESLLTAGADVNMQGGYHGSALQAASYKGYKDIVERLLTAGADVNAQGGVSGNALLAALRSRSFKSVEVLERLLAAGADVNAHGRLFGNSALQAAVSLHPVGVVKRLLTAGADVNAQGGLYGNALQAVARIRSIEVVERLLTAGADVNAQGGDYGNALQAAVVRGSIEVVERLLVAGADINVLGGKYGNALQAAARYGSIEVVERLLVAGADVNAQGGCFGSVLQAAAYRGSIKVVERLLAAGADINVLGGEYGNALQAAAIRGFRGVVERLLATGANVNAQGGKYGNALQAAARYGSIEVVERLLTAGADVNAQGGCYGNALQAARETNHGKIADMLLAAGAVPMEDDQPQLEEVDEV
ncbi:Pfs, NACHT and ankyrin domain protein [Hortaea werneckii]|nr:Pfs, NACHT and ankyrin domain protein [Hortaea werneckii]KAI7206380.1 Pfs, NACHT and ankyrin domain protein [Hortaea werneckii]